MYKAIAVIALVIVVCVLKLDTIQRFASAGSKPAPASVAAVSADAARSAPAAQQSSVGRTVTLRADARGHYQVEARIDGRRVEALVDTGASRVVLNERSANSLGIFPRAADYTGRSNTANGVGKFAPVRLNRVEVNGITVYNVDAAVVPNDALSTNLLGMSFLSKVKFAHERNKLVLEQ